MAERKKRIGRPTKPGTAGQRNSLGLRVTAETKRELEFAALKSGRSQSQEAEFRIVQSFLEEAAYGGRELHGLLKLMVAVVEIIQARNGKSASDDWETGLAAGYAWRRLIYDWLPKPPAEWIAEASWRSDAMSNVPERPKVPARGGLLVPRAPEEEWETYRERLQKYAKDQEAFFIEYDEHMAAFRKIQDDFNKALEIGEEALGLLSDQEK